MPGKRKMKLVGPCWLDYERCIVGLIEEEIVRVVYDIAVWFGRLFASVGMLIVGPQGEGGGGWKECMQGIIMRQDMKQSELDTIGTRVGAIIVGSLIAVNIIGALFAISPPFLALLAVLVGFVWPTWAPNCLNAFVS
jgi:hypothetical protein